ncbi:nonsense-mediated mRNA decay factor SMG7-like [Argiope bruennichi]|uniref:Protein SMG7 like protein n=1 Tax=Argiope bruennichi TaxID=94029 RepID=A0A8T0E490_ARGBR|nr:nonsense-mediated mRNA decay factor SMG7-like [Argiope bruennichi]KAF8764074.1 Protein SMG7 like protein [Argiope bruennichi]
MKASPSQIFKEAETLKASLSGESLPNNDIWQKRQELCHLFESLLLIDLDYALDKKVEQDLWSFIFRNPISACQSKAREHKKSNHSYSNSQLSTLLETASGFYLQLLQKLCCAYDIDLPCHPRDSVYGLTKEWISRYPVAHQPRKSSLLYICQHCLVHLGDIARYRGQSLQAENFYRHAVDLVPSNGQPYNQLALLEAASGEKLSTVFFYVRSLCVQHPFPLAANNLQNLFSKMSSDGSVGEGKTRMTAFEYVSVFLQFHAVIHLNNDLKKIDPMINKLTTSLPALIIAEKFETWQLVQMVAVCLFAIEHAWGTVDVDKNSSHFDETMLSPEELKASSLIEELLASMLHAFLLPVHASLDPKETANYYTLPAIKIILDWLLQDPQLLQHEAITKNPQVWHGLCKLLNDLDVATKEPFDLKKFEDIPLPEDWDLQSFLPLKKSQRRLKFSLNAATPSDEESTWLRSIRLCKLGECLAGVTMEGLNLLSLSQSDGKRIFKAIHQTESLSEEVLQQIQELTVNPSPVTSLNDTPVLVNGNTTNEISNTSLRSKPGHGEGMPQQEVRFKLDDTQQRREKSDSDRELQNEKLERRNKDNSSNTGRERRSGRQNVAMQAILQQRAAQMTTGHGRGQENSKENNSSVHQESVSRQNVRPQNHVDNSHLIRPALENCMGPQVVKEANLNRPIHHVTQDQFNQFQQQAISVNNVQPCERNEAWIQQFNIHQPGIGPLNQVPRDNNPVANYVQNSLSRVVRTSAPNFNFQQQQPLPPPPQQQTQPNQMIAKQVTPTTYINPPNMLWNYMGFVAPYQQACAGNPTPPGTQIIMQQGTNQTPRQQPSFYMMNGTQQELTPIDATYAYRNAPNGSTILQQQAPELIRDQVQEHLANQARLWQQENGRNDIATNHLMNQVVGRPVAQTLQNTLSAQQLQNAGASVSSALPHELSSNTYSLFNSSWPSGISIPRANKETQHNNMDPVFMQSRIQSLWSGPGPSPLERLLEQQKQRRDGATQ